MSATETMTNGEKTSSQFITHLTSYPLVSESLSTYQSNPYGAKSISFVQSLYIKLAEPILPYLQTPYSILAPYLAKADHLGDASLAKLDEHVPAVKSTDYSTLKSTAFSIAHFPLKKAGEGKEYVFSTYNDEYTKTGGKGVVTTGKAVLSTELRIAAEAFDTVWSYVGPKVEDTKKTAHGKIDAARKKGEEHKKKHLNHQ